MPEPQPFDVVVIGAGPAGCAAANTAALLGKKVAVVEKNPAVGGAAINTGTIPSKTLRETAVALSGMRARALYGVDLSLRREATVDDFLRHERQVRTVEAAQARHLLGRFGVTVLTGTGSFVDPHTVKVTHPTPPGGSTLLSAEKVVVAIGSAPSRPPLFPFQHNRVHDSDELLYLTSMPRSLAVVGAGVIGSEYACMFAVLGTRVHLVDGRDALLPFLDHDLSAALAAAMTRQGVVFHWKENVTAVTAPRVGEIELTLTSGDTVTVDHVLVCAGRTSPTAGLNPGAAGVGLTGRGLIPVDEHYRTTVPHIYAVGDVIGFPALASTGAEQGRVAACHACGSSLLTGLSAVLPTGIYTIPEVSCAGLTEGQAREKGIDYVVGRGEYAHNPRGQIIGDKTGFLKLVFRREDMKLLGVHVIGELASEVVHVGLTALVTGSGADLFLNTCFNYPTLGDLYKLAASDALLKRDKLGRDPAILEGNW
ncbi:MAG: Si-specific NAD(P)(+) transhydrogenase [Isosphaera sp.]|nr:Si-specific NAD(P)(+) transhydrogenase [Isosphaera sp.]